MRGARIGQPASAGNAAAPMRVAVGLALRLDIALRIPRRAAHCCAPV